MAVRLWRFESSSGHFSSLLRQRLRVFRLRAFSALRMKAAIASDARPRSRELGAHDAR